MFLELLCSWFEDENVEPKCQRAWIWIHALFYIHKAITSMLGDVSFFVYGSKLWNGFPNGHKEYQQGVCHTVALPFTLLKSIFKAKEGLWKFNILPCKKIIFEKNPLSHLIGPSPIFLEHGGTPEHRSLSTQHISRLCCLCLPFYKLCKWML